MNRITVLAIAAIVALGSGFGLVRYVAGAESRATSSASPVPVLTAAKDVPAGTSFDEAWADGSIVQSRIAQAMRPPTAVTDPAALKGMVTDGVLRQGQLVVQGTFAAPDQANGPALPPTFADDLPEGSVAVSFDVTGAHAVSNLVSPGDLVNLLVQVPNASELGLPDSGGPALVSVFQDLRVIAIGAAVAPKSGSSTAVANPGAGSYTVAVAPRDAARLLYLTRQYEVYLALVGPGTKPTPQSPVTKSDALPGSLTPDEGVAKSRVGAP